MKKEWRMTFRFRTLAFVGNFLLLMILGALPAILYGGLETLIAQKQYMIWYFLYWLMLTTMFFTFVTNQQKRTFEKPLKLLGDATRKVAGGDFSVFVKPLHSPDRYTYIDYMFEDFNSMVKELGSIETMKTDFVNNISHEIKTPLAVIENAATILQSPSLSNDERERYTSIICQASRRLNSLVENILRLGKLENQNIQSGKGTYDLMRQLSDSAITFEDEIEGKHLDFSIDGDDRHMVNTDSQLLQIVWRNLLANAIKYTPNGGKITIKVMDDTRETSVSVSDTGCGMTKETMKHLGEKFYREYSQSDIPGNGLGLAIVKKVLESTGCSLSVASEKGKGSCFTVHIPK